MKKVSMYSLVIGIGMGIIITSLFNIIWFQLSETSEEIKKTSINNGHINSTDIKTTFLPESSIKIGMDEKDLANNIKDQNYYIHIVKGMNSEQIAELLKNNGIIDSKEEFNFQALKLQLDKNFKYGYIQIPKGSNIDEIISILTK